MLLVHMCKMIISPGVFFHFFKILIFWVVRGVKRQKIVQNGKKFCPSHLISQEPYIIWLSFSVHFYKMMISSGVSFIFSKLWFSGSIGGGWGKRAKDGPRWKNSVCHAQYLRNHTSYDCCLWCRCIKWEYLLVVSSIFQNFDFPGCRDWKGKKRPKMTKNYVCLTLISRTIHHMSK